MTSKPLILVARGVRSLRNGNRSAKDYPFWGELIEKLKLHYEIQEIKELPLNELETLINSSLTVICCDSFCQHFCWSIGKRALVLWGKSDPEIFGHVENVNIWKDKKYFRPDPYRWWEDVPYQPEAFPSPDQVINCLRINFT
jgi:hypothetical protein